MDRIMVAVIVGGVLRRLAFETPVQRGEFSILSERGQVVRLRFLRTAEPAIDSHLKIPTEGLSSVG
jgi:hypothetical protein